MLSIKEFSGTHGSFTSTSSSKARGALQRRKPKECKVSQYGRELWNAHFRTWHSCCSHQLPAAVVTCAWSSQSQYRKDGGGAKASSLELRREGDSLFFGDVIPGRFPPAPADVPPHTWVLNRHRRLLITIKGHEVEKEVGFGGDTRSIGGREGAIDEYDQCGLHEIET